MDLDLTLPPSLPTAQAHREEGTGARLLGFLRTSLPDTADKTSACWEGVQ